MNPSQQSQNQAVAIASGTQPTINNTGVDMGALADEYRLSKSYVEQYSRDFKYLDDLVDGVTINRDNDAPFVGDTTLAGLVRSIPRNSLQQLPVYSARVNGSKGSIPALLCSFFLKKFAFNEDTFGKGLLSTLQIGGEQALSHGYAPFFVATGIMYNDFGTTLRLLHFMDTALEPGVTDSNESGYHYVVANLTATRVRKILKAAQANPNTTWNVDALKQVLQAQPRAKDYSIYESAARRNQAGEQMGPTYEFVTRYETGQGATIVTFCPEMTEAPLRVMDSKSKFGYPRVQYLVIDPAALTPFGTSRVRLASPNQNLMNIYYGQIAAMLLLNSKPPILQRGRFLKPVELKRGVTWITTDPQADAKLVNMDGGALENFVTMAQQFASQIQNIMGGQTATANPTQKFSKTGPGVKQAQTFMDVNTNQITKILENFLRQYALVALDTMLSEQEGVEKIYVDDDTMNAINTVAPGTIGDDHKIEIDWQRFYQGIEDWTVDIDVSMTPDQLKDEKRGDLQDLLVVLAQNAEELGPEAVQKVQEVADMLIQDASPLLKPIAVTGQPTPQGGPAHAPREMINYKDVAGSPAGNAMLDQAQLPSGGGQ